MKNSRLFQLFSQLPAKDLRELDKFIHSPFFNQRESITRFWEFLLHHYNDLGVIPENEAAFRKAYPEQPYDDQAMRLLRSDLYKLILQYVGCTELLSYPTNMKIAQASGLRKRKYFPQAHTTLKQTEKSLQKSKVKNAVYYLNSYRLQLERYQLVSTDQPTGALHLQELSDTIDISYLIEKLRQTCLLLSHQNVYQSDYQIGLLEAIIPHIQKNNLLQIPAITVYYHCYLSLTQSEEEERFQEFKNALFEHGHCFPAAELRDLYLLAVNYCVRQANDGREIYLREVLEIYKQGLQTSSLLENEVLSRFTYHNIVAAGIKTGDFSWVESFIHQYRNSLEKKYRESSFSFNLARMEYSRQRYEKALPLLQKANYKDLLLNLAAKTLLLKIYYELDEPDLLHAHLDAMKNFIQRKKVIGYHRTNYLNIVRYSRRLLQLNPYNKKQVIEFRAAVAVEEPLTEKEWLLGRVS